MSEEYYPSENTDLVRVYHDNEDRDEEPHLVRQCDIPWRDGYPYCPKCDKLVWNIEL